MKVSIGGDAIACCVAVLASAAQAQSASVSDDQATGLAWVGTAGDASVTGFRQQYRGDVPPSVQVPSAEKLAIAGVAHLYDALDFASGVAHQNKLGGSYDSFAVRGSAGRLGEIGFRFRDGPFLELPASTFARLQAKLEVTEQLRVPGEITNLFDEQYDASSYSRLWLMPGAPRQFFVRAGFRP